MRLHLLSPALAMLAVAGCASSGTPEPATNGSPATASATTSGTVQRWSGALSPTIQRTANIAGGDRARAFGNVTLTRHPTDEGRMLVSLSLTAPATSSITGLQWALLPGRCGSGAVPVTSVDRFPPIEMGSGNRGTLNTDVAIALPQSGAYHVNVYWPGGSQLENVMTCANLRAEG
jgi:hypothetical protein